MKLEVNNIEDFLAFSAEQLNDAYSRMDMKKHGWTKSIATNRCSIYEEPQRLLRLKASNIMQRTGNVFDPDYFLLDEESHLVYRKEQFESDEQLSTEYVIADYRFTIEEFASECTALGFKVRSISPVQLGHWDTPLDPCDIRAKEVVFVVEK